MTKNANLHSAKREKNDEFYTQLTDIEKEVIHYKEHFKDKIVLCNCNDALHGNFVKYFTLNFEVFGLQKLIYTSYEENASVYVYDGKETESWKLSSNGDFRSQDMIELLEISDIVVTNPPFSLFREYVAQLMEYNKKFLIIGNLNAITYKEIFPFIKENKMWLGISLHATKCSFIVNNDYQGLNTYFDNGIKYAKVNNSVWFTNINHNKRNTQIDLYKHYTEEEYPKYDNYNAIEVSKVSNIPLDYDGVMGVPITFIDKYCPMQFEIVGWSRHNDMNMDGGYWLGGKADATINGKEVYRRILIKKINSHD